MKDRITTEYARLLRQVSAIEPSSEALERALSRARKALPDGPIRATGVPSETLAFGGRRVFRFAAAMAAVLLVALGGLCLLFVPSPSAFAQVQSAIHQIPAITFSVEILKAPERVVTKPGTSMVDLVGNRFRFESSDGAEINVMDGKHGMYMLLYPREQRATVVRSRPSNAASFAEFIKGVRDCDADGVEQLKDAELDGRTVERYRIRPEASLSGGVEMLVSIDPRTHLPVRIESTTDALGEPLHFVCKDFAFDALDPALFATVPPQGYKLDNPEEENQPKQWPTTLAPEEVVPAAADLGVPSVNIEFRVAEQAPGKGLVEAAMPNNPSQILYLHPDSIVTREHIQNLRLIESGQTIEITFTDAGSARMAKATSQVPKQLAVLIDGKVVCAPIVHSAISKKASITGSPDVMHLFSEPAKPR